MRSGTVFFFLIILQLGFSSPVADPGPKRPRVAAGVLAQDAEPAEGDEPAADEPGAGEEGGEGSAEEGAEVSGEGEADPGAEGSGGEGDDAAGSGEDGGAGAEGAADPDLPTGIADKVEGKAVAMKV